MSLDSWERHCSDGFSGFRNMKDAESLSVYRCARPMAPAKTGRHGCLCWVPEPESVNLRWLCDRAISICICIIQTWLFISFHFPGCSWQQSTRDGKAGALRLVYWYFRSTPGGPFRFPSNLVGRQDGGFACCGRRHFWDCLRKREQMRHLSYRARASWTSCWQMLVTAIGALWATWGTVADAAYRWNEAMPEWTCAVYWCLWLFASRRAYECHHGTASQLGHSEYTTGWL